MQTLKGAINIYGSAPRHSSVEIRGVGGKVLGVTTADGLGEFQLSGVTLEPGEHKCRAICTPTNGPVVESPELALSIEAEDDRSDDVEASAFDPAASFDDSLSLEELVELAQLRHERRARAEARYVELVEACVDGFEVDSFLGEMVVEASGRTLDDFARDAKELTELRRQEEASERRFRAKCDELRRRAAWS